MHVYTVLPQDNLNHAASAAANASVSLAGLVVALCVVVVIENPHHSPVPRAHSPNVNT